MLPPTIKQEAAEHLAALMSPPAPAGVRVKPELADLAEPPPPKRARAAEVGPVVPCTPWATYPPPAALQPQPATVDDDGAARLGAPPRTSLAPTP